MRHVSLVNAEPCVWMAAGLVSYKLCDREFDCHRCPLDAALRGGSTVGPDAGFAPADGRRNHGFPDDRRYAAGHTWIATGFGRGSAGVRIGLDGFAAALLPRPVAVTGPSGPCALSPGDVLCDIELPEGTLSVRSPIAGLLERENAALQQHPGLIVESPYHDGWIAELMPAADPATLGDLLDAGQARDRSHIHLRHFRRRIALRLLADVVNVGPTMQDGGQALISLSEILGGPQYLRILREVLR
jgi:glycine cleavage system H protein